MAKQKQQFRNSETWQINLFSSRTVLHGTVLLKISMFHQTQKFHMFCYTIQRHLPGGAVWTFLDSLFCGSSRHRPQPGWLGPGCFLFFLRESFGSFNPELWSKGDFNLGRINMWFGVQIASYHASLRVPPPTHPQKKNCRLNESSIRPAISLEGGIGGVGPLDFQDHIQGFPSKRCRKNTPFSWTTQIALNVQYPSC